MTVKQAIDVLQKCPPDAVIVVCNDGGEGYVEIDVWGVQPSTEWMDVFLIDDGSRSLPGANVVLLD